MKRTSAIILTHVALLVLFSGIWNFAAAQKRVNREISASPEAVILSDNFESYAVGSTFPAGTWANSNSAAVWSIQSDGSNIARQSGAVTSIITNGNTAWTDYSVSGRVKFHALGYRSGVIGRFASTSAYYMLYIRTTAGGSKVVELSKRVNSTNTPLNALTLNTLAVGTFYKLTLEMNGSEIKGYVDDTLRVQATDTQYTAGKAGFYNTGDTSNDDFSVSDSSTAPDAPTNLNAVSGNSQIALNWSAPSGATSYKVKRSLTDGGLYAEIATATGTTYTDFDVSNGVTYYYVVSASNAAGDGPNSTQASATGQVLTPAAPSGQHTASGNQEAKIYWVGSFSATGYNVKRSPTSSGTYVTIAENVAAEEYTDTGLTNNTTYWYRITAVNSAGESAPTSAVSALPRIGAVVNVTTTAELTSALNIAVAGDEIILADGNYSAFKVRRKYGTAAQPIVVRALNPRGAVFNAGQLELQNTVWMTFEGFRWTLSTSIKLRGTEHNRMTRNAFEFNETGITDLDWVTIAGTGSHHNRIDHNDFKNKVTLGNYMTLGGDNGQTTRYDLIDHNYFFNLGPRVDNEKETIRVGDSSVSRSSGFTTIEHNLFVQCDGDPEIVSVKTHDNIVRYNTFRRSKGGLTSRQGNRNTFYGNFFLGEGVEGTGGIRVYGDDHKIYNNYFEGLTGTSNYAPIAITNGDADGAELPGADQSLHYRPQRITVTNNTIVGNTSNIEIGGSYTLPPRDIMISNNIITGSTGQMVKYRTAPINPTYAGNIAFPTGTATLGITATEAEFRIIDPVLVTAGEVKKLDTGSPAIDASANNYPFVTEDFEGQSRDAMCDVGADEFGAFTPVRLPLTEANAGLNSDDHSISGRIVNGSGVGLADVTVTLNNTEARGTENAVATVVTDAQGYYNITGIEPNGDYTVSFAKQGYTFTPASVPVSNLSSDMNVAASGSLAPTAASVRVTGQVMNGAMPVAKARVTLTSSTGETVTFLSTPLGHFNFEDVVSGQIYIIAVESKGYQAEPQLLSVDDDINDLVIQALRLN